MRWEEPLLGRAAMWGTAPLFQQGQARVLLWAGLGLCCFTPFVRMAEGTCRARLVAIRGQRYCSSFLKVLPNTVKAISVPNQLLFRSSKNRCCVLRTQITLLFARSPCSRVTKK